MMAPVLLYLESSASIFLEIRGKQLSTIILACETIRDEIDKARALTHVDHPIIWVESGLHNHPEKLRAVLQDHLDEGNGYKRVLMAFGSCGNSVIGLKTGNYELIIPRVDDCISMMIGSVEKRMDIGKAGGTYFLTPGWLRGERNIWAEYEYSCDKYGKETARSIMEMMLEHYVYLGLVDTQSFDASQVYPEIERIAKELNLEPKIIPASVDYLCRLFVGPWDNEQFVVVPANSVIEEFALNL